MDKGVFSLEYQILGMKWQYYLKTLEEVKMDQPMPMLLVVKCKLQVKEKLDIFYLR